jgi:hypothetical protein
MIIELSGAPGAGKSFVMRADVMPAHRDHKGALPVAMGPDFARDTRLWHEVVSVLPDRLASPVLWRLLERRRRRGLQTFRQRYESLFELVENHQSLRPRASKHRERRAVEHWHKACADFEIARDRSEIVFVADEGLIHRIVQLFTSAEEEVPEQLIEQYCALIPTPDRLYFVNTPVDVCIDRLKQRGLWTPWTDMDEVARFAVNAHRASEIAASAVAERGVEVIVVANAEPRTVER